MLILGLGWTSYVHFAAPILPFDDAYITYRHVDNFVAGNGPVYNPGERIFGCSTPLYFIWLASLKFVTGMDLPMLAVRSNALWYAMSCAGCMALLFRLSGSYGLAALGGGFLCMDRSQLAISTGGMESFLFVSLALGCLIACTYRQPFLTGTLLGFAILARLEGICLLPVIFLVYRPRQLLRAVFSCCIVLGLWVVPALLYFGTAVPHSIKAKAAPLYILPWFQGAFTCLSQLGREFAWDFASRHFTSRLSLAEGALIVGLIAAGGLIQAARNPRGLVAAAPAVFVLGVIAMYGVANTLIADWYFPSVIVAALVACLLAIHAVARMLPHAAAGWPLSVVVTTSLAVAWVVFASIRPSAGEHLRLVSPMQMAREDAARLRVVTYLRCAEWLNQHAGRGDVVAAPEIGGFGFAYRGPILDPCGLVSPQAIPYLPSQGALLPEFIAATRPKWIVTMPIFASTLLASQWFNDQYQLESSFELPVVAYQSREVLIYRLR